MHHIQKDRFSEHSFPSMISDAPEWYTILNITNFSILGYSRDEEEYD
jgi:hypothetical protein